MGESAGRRLALVIATATYADRTLRKLKAPGQDAADLAGVLQDTAIGGFEVETVLDGSADAIRRRIANFCANGRPNDLTLIYLSCHGILDDRGRLYYATADTDRSLLSITAVQSAWLNEQLEDCASRRQIMILDCCHSGAFDAHAKGEGALALQDRFGHRGRVVLTGSRATEYSFEGDRIVGDGVSSVFTAAIVAGLQTGEADTNRDGLVTVNELYDYAYHAVRARQAPQTPSLWAYGAEGDLLVAHNPSGAFVEPSPLPEDLALALESPRPRIRQGAVAELALLLAAEDRGRALTARARLEHIAAADLPDVAADARAILEAHPEHGVPPPSPRAGRSAAPASGGAELDVAVGLRAWLRDHTALASVTVAVVVTIAGIAVAAAVAIVQSGSDQRSAQRTSTRSVATIRGPKPLSDFVVGEAAQRLRLSPSCPSNCQAITRTTGFNVQQAGVRGLDQVPAPGEIVGWSIRLARVGPKQTRFFASRYGGDARAGISILRPVGSDRYRLIARSPTRRLNAQFGRTAEFDLERPLRVAEHDIVALTVPTWAPTLATHVKGSSRWRSSRRRSGCLDTIAETTHSVVGSLKSYYCRSEANLIYSARFRP